MTGGLTGRDVRSHFDHLAKRYDVLCRWNTAVIQHHATRTMATISRHAELSPSSVVLDFGCGTGFYTRMIGDLVHQVIGVDLSYQMLQKGRSAAEEQIGFIQGDGQELPFRDRSFDLVVSVSVFEHVVDAVSVLRELARVVKTGGRVITIVPNRANHWVEVQKFFRIGDPEQLGMEWRRTEQEMRTFYEAAGLKDIRSNTFLFVSGRFPNALLHPTQWIERVLELWAFARRFAGTIAISGVP